MKYSARIKWLPVKVRVLICYRQMAIQNRLCDSSQNVHAASITVRNHLFWLYINIPNDQYLILFLKEPNYS